MKAFDKKLKAAVKLLPESNPKNELWDKINQQLNFNNKLSDKTKQLASFEPEEKLWNQIEQNIKTKNKKPKQRNLIYLTSAAASIVIIIGLRLLLSSPKHETITITEETVNTWQQPFNNANDTLSAHGIEFINEQCTNKSYICNLPAFNEKKQQLNDLEIQIKNIEQVINTSGSSSSLIKTRIKLENMKTRVMKDLINMIAS
jgi:hypothetical protein